MNGWATRYKRTSLRKTVSRYEHGYAQIRFALGEWNDNDKPIVFCVQDLLAELEALRCPWVSVEELEENKRYFVQIWVDQGMGHGRSVWRAATFKLGEMVYDDPQVTPDLATEITRVMPIPELNDGE